MERWMWSWSVGTSFVTQPMSRFDEKVVRSSQIVKLWYVYCVSLFSDWDFLWNVWGRDLWWKCPSQFAKEAQATRRESCTVCWNSWTGSYHEVDALQCDSEILSRCSSFWITKTWWPCWRCANSGRQWQSGPSCGPSSGQVTRNLL